MLSCVVNSRFYPRRSQGPLELRHGDENFLIASPLDSAFVIQNAPKSFRIRFCESCLVSPPVSRRNFKSYSRCLYSSRALCTLLSFFASRVFHNSFAHKSFRTLSKKCRGVTPFFPKRNSSSSGSRAHLASGQNHESLVTNRLLRLTPSFSADSINLLPADRSFRRQFHPRGGGIP
jgi:hypothetical protein